jgi:hypothetical protein
VGGNERGEGFKGKGGIRPPPLSNAKLRPWSKVTRNYILVSVNLHWRTMTSFTISRFKMRSKTPQVVNFANRNLKNTSDVVLETRGSARDYLRHVCQKSRFGLGN